MTKYFLDKEKCLIELYNLVLNERTNEKERAVYKKAIELIEVENEYYEAVLARIASKLVILAMNKLLSEDGLKLLNKISRYGNDRLVPF